MSHSDEIHTIPGGVTAAAGFEAGAGEGGIRYRNRPDVGILLCRERAAAAAVFTKNIVTAAPIHISREHLAATQGYARAIVVNAGNANACTGKPGLLAASEMASLTARSVGVSAEEVLVASTGVIGIALPMGAVGRGIAAAKGSLKPNGSAEFARAIMTTDLVPKEYAVEFQADGKTCRVGGCCKGSGMIAPNMATMLAFLTTDVSASPALLQDLLTEAVGKTFNRMTVDGDCSTNDTVFLLASGVSGVSVDDNGELRELFDAALKTVCRELTKQLARDGEGATKLVEVTVCGAQTEGDAERCAKAIAESCLVKTAIYGNDANWGRILCAAGYSGAIFDPNRVDLWIEELKLVEDGMTTDYGEDAAKKLFERDPFHIVLDLNAGMREATVWTCDLTDKYIEINASYRS